MNIDDDLQSCYIDDLDEIEIDPILDNLTEQELWRYLQILILGKNMETEFAIHVEEMDMSDMNQNYVVVDSPAWSNQDEDDDDELNRCILFNTGNINYETPVHTDEDEYDNENE